ncbi:uncharacterized protein LOC110268300 [Arachis ipaensis]|uniref:uncharacterized protein LOC110268300 n=1 Tax=Arachis ipaensis TaxID=130454 RepID=UPI000A2B7D84|nr:uncharacterized protein LOC110268300 [Arachis ipaensis]
MMRFPPSCWSKSHFSHGPKVDNITNNMCEVWNAKIVGYREKPILTLCEELRCYIMQKMANHKRKLAKYNGKLAPVQQIKLEQIVMPESIKWNAVWNGDNDKAIYEVQKNSHKVGVNLKEHTCTCNVWQLTGLPCKHAVAVIFRLKNMGYKLEDFVDKSLTMDAVRAAYSYVIQPVNSDEYWIPTDCQ